MEEIRRVAFATVQRACLFGSLAIFCTMVGLAPEPRLAFKAGGALTVIMALILVYKAYEARTKSYRKTEMWIYLREDSRPPEDHAQWAVSTVMRDTYLTFAFWTSAIAVIMWAMAFVLMLFGI